MENENQHVEAVAVTANALEQIERASIDIQIATAHKYPQHKTEQLSKVKADMLSFATLDEETAAACFYTLPRGNKVIQGPSIRMAEIAVSCYGNIRNCVRTIEVVSTGATPHVVVQAVCHDLEKNVAVSIEKRRRITKKKRNQFIDEDDITLAVNAATAITFRDAAFKVIPQALIKPVWEAAKKVAIGDIRSIVETRTKCIERLNKMGVTDDRILFVLECRAIEDIGQPQLEILFGLGTAIKDGDCTLEEAFPKELKGSTTDRIKDKFKETDQKQEPAPKKGKKTTKKKEKPKTEPGNEPDQENEPENTYKDSMKKDEDGNCTHVPKETEAEQVKCPNCDHVGDPAIRHICDRDETVQPQPDEEPKLVKCPICSKDVDSAKPHDCSEPGDAKTTEPTEDTLAIGKATHKCGICDRQFTKEELLDDGKKCPKCFSLKILELS